MSAGGKPYSGPISTWSVKDKEKAVKYCKNLSQEEFDAKKEGKKLPPQKRKSEVGEPCATYDCAGDKVAKHRMWRPYCPSEEKYQGKGIHDDCCCATWDDQFYLSWMTAEWRKSKTQAGRRCDGGSGDGTIDMSISTISTITKIIREFKPEPMHVVPMAPFIPYIELPIIKQLEAADIIYDNVIVVPKVVVPDQTVVVPDAVKPLIPIAIYELEEPLEEIQDGVVIQPLLNEFDELEETQELSQDGVVIQPLLDAYDELEETQELSQDGVVVQPKDKKGSTGEDKVKKGCGGLDDPTEDACKNKTPHDGGICCWEGPQEATWGGGKQASKGKAKCWENLTGSCPKTKKTVVVDLTGADPCVKCLMKGNYWIGQVDGAKSSGDAHADTQVAGRCTPFPISGGEGLKSQDNRNRKGSGPNTDKLGTQNEKGGTGKKYSENDAKKECNPHTTQNAVEQAQKNAIRFLRVNK